MKKFGLYTEKVMKHFKNPHNMGRIKNPDVIGWAGNFVCGDIMQLYLKIGKNKKGREIIKDISFETLGCVAAIATSSVITDLVKGKALEDALEFNREEIIKQLGGLPASKIHCSVLAVDALYEAIYDYLKKKKRKIPEKLLKIHQRIEKEEKDIKNG